LEENGLLLKWRILWRLSLLFLFIPFTGFLFAEVLPHGRTDLPANQQRVPTFVRITSALHVKAPKQWKSKIVDGKNEVKKRVIFCPFFCPP
jgi:hypothetical protein